jgi:hypothetical protein
MFGISKNTYSLSTGKGSLKHTVHWESFGQPDEKNKLVWICDEASVRCCGKYPSPEISKQILVHRKMCNEIISFKSLIV